MQNTAPKAVKSKAVLHATQPASKNEQDPVVQPDHSAPSETNDMPGR